MRTGLYIDYITSIVIALLLGGCIGVDDHQTNDVTPPINEEPETYTIIYYAVGGETLDKAIEMSITSVVGNLSENIKLTGCVKWTDNYKSELCDSEGGTYRFIHTEQSGELRLEHVGDSNFPMYEPENIADFICWSKEVAPADNYILVLAGHGNGWHPEVGLTAGGESTRGTLRDTGLDRYISLEELCAGVAASQTHFRMIHMISCLMNNVEYITSLAPYCDYILGSSHISVMLCSELRILCFVLGNMIDNQAETFIEAMTNYLSDIDNDIKYHSNLEEETIDFVLTDTHEVAALNREVGLLTDRLIQIYDLSDSLGEEEFVGKYGATIAEMERAVAQSYYFISAHIAPEDMATTEYLRMAFSYDLVDIAHRIATTIEDDAIRDIATAIETQAERARILHYIKSPNNSLNVYYGITLTNSILWAERGYSEAGYEETPFDKATGWSRFLKRNNIEVAY